MHVLYIEDNDGNARLLEKFFSINPAWRLTLAATAEDGLVLAQHAAPHLILMDINLPGQSGIEALHELRASPLTAAIPVLAISADARPEYIARVLEEGFDAYITKPLDLRALEQTLVQYAPCAGEP
ncbi:MAG: response regulator [Gammaproteobacteria bacterium]